MEEKIRTEASCESNLLRQPREYPIGSFIGGEYKILDRFVGGMGYVYLVEHRELDLPIVLKTLQEPDDSAAQAAFRREVESWIGFGKHPNIVEARFYRSLDGLPFIAAEYVRPQSGGYNSIDDYVAIDVEPQTILKWAIQFCDGMDYAAANGLVAHRDIKPANLLVDDWGNLKISDFGLARIYKPRSGLEESTAERTAIAGTLAFMAPEQLLSPQDVDTRADIWAFGVVLSLLLTGVYPFNGSTEESIIAGILSDPAKIGENFLTDICTKCLRKDRRERFGAIADLRNELMLAGQKSQLKVSGWSQRLSDECESLFAKVLSHRELTNRDLASKYLKQFLERFPDDYRGWNELGRHRLESRQFSMAVESFHASLKRNPFNTRAWNNLGVALKESEKLNDAIDAFEKAISIDPLNTGAMLNLSNAFKSLRRPVAAIQVLENAISITPEKASLWVNLGAALDLGDFVEAKKSFERALELHPRLSEAVENLRLLREAVQQYSAQPPQNVGLLIQKGKFSEARELLKSRIATNPGDKDALHNLGIIALHENHPYDAMQWFEKVVELDGMEEFALTQLIKIKCQFQEYESAASTARNSHIPNCEVKEVSFRNQILRELGASQQAVDCLKAAIVRFPNSDTLWFMLADCLKDFGRIRESMDAANRCLHLLLDSKGKSENIAMVQELIDRLRMLC